MHILTEPMTIEEIKKNRSEDNYVEGIVPISLDQVIHNDFETFLDIISNKLVGSILLMDVNYSVVGHQDEYTILLNVSGDASQIIDDEGEDENE